jgi:hypothetical protein
MIGNTAESVAFGLRFDRANQLAIYKQPIVCRTTAPSIGIGCSAGVRCLGHQSGNEVRTTCVSRWIHHSTRAVVDPSAYADGFGLPFGTLSELRGPVSALIDKAAEGLGVAPRGAVRFIRGLGSATPSGLGLVDCDPGVVARQHAFNPRLFFHAFSVKALECADLSAL